MTAQYKDEIQTLEVERKSIETVLLPLRKQYKDIERQIGEIQKKWDEEVLSQNVSLVEWMRKAGAEYIFPEANKAPDYRDAFEDDGSLHIVLGQVRGCFINDEEMKKSEWNKIARRVLKEFGFKFSDLK